MYPKSVMGCPSETGFQNALSVLYLLYKWNANLAFCRFCLIRSIFPNLLSAWVSMQVLQ